MSKIITFFVWIVFLIPSLSYAQIYESSEAKAKYQYSLSVSAHSEFKGDGFARAFDRYSTQGVRRFISQWIRTCQGSICNGQHETAFSFAFIEPKTQLFDDSFAIGFFDGLTQVGSQYTFRNYMNSHVDWGVPIQYSLNEDFQAEIKLRTSKPYSFFYVVPINTSLLRVQTPDGGSLDETIQGQIEHQQRYDIDRNGGASNHGDYMKHF